MKPKSQWAHEGMSHYHIGYRCAKSHAQPIYDVRYAHKNNGDAVQGRRTTSSSRR